MLNFGASKPRVRGGPAPGAPPGSAPVQTDMTEIIINYHTRMVNINFVLHCTNIYYRPQQSWGKVIFSQASSILSTWGEGCVVSQHALQVVSEHAWQQGVLSQHALQVVSQHALQQGGTWSGGPLQGGLLPGGTGGDPPPDGHCCGRYASYWNAFLLKLCS